jgi:hypothetical protein
MGAESSTCISSNRCDSSDGGICGQVLLQPAGNQQLKAQVF